MISKKNKLDSINDVTINIGLKIKFVSAKQLKKLIDVLDFNSDNSIDYKKLDKIICLSKRPLVSSQMDYDFERIGDLYYASYKIEIVG